jgi:hypothetical protein
MQRYNPCFWENARLSSHSPDSASTVATWQPKAINELSAASFQDFSPART